MKHNIGAIVRVDKEHDDHHNVGGVVQNAQVHKQSGRMLYQVVVQD
jgi:hypothetical protein